MGHISTLVDGVYISHWPDKSNNRNVFKKQGLARQTLQDDIEMEGREPDETQLIPIERVNVGKIHVWWNLLTAGGTNYHLLRNNCAQIVKQALIVGGFGNRRGRRLREILTLHKVVLTPYSVLKWIKIEMAAEERTFLDWIQSLLSCFIIGVSHCLP